MLRKSKFIKPLNVHEYVKGINKRITVTPGFLYMLDHHVKFLIEEAIRRNTSSYKLDIATAAITGIESYHPSGGSI